MTGRTSPAPLFGLAPGGVCRASLSPGCWWALTPPFHPYLDEGRVASRISVHSPLATHLGGILSVALSLSLRTVGVTHHRVLWSPDFPLPGPSWYALRASTPFRAATVQPTWDAFHYIL